MKKYCPSCGKQNPVSAKYCCHCGDSTSLAKKVKSKPAPIKGIAYDDEDDEEYDVSQIRITASKLDIEIMPNLQTGETIGSLMQAGEQLGPETSVGYKKGGGPKIDEKRFLEEFRREAGPIKGNQSIGEG